MFCVVLCCFVLFFFPSCFTLGFRKCLCRSRTGGGGGFQIQVLIKRGLMEHILLCFLFLRKGHLHLCLSMKGLLI